MDLAQSIAVLIVALAVLVFATGGAIEHWWKGEEAQARKEALNGLAGIWLILALIAIVGVMLALYHLLPWGWHRIVG